MHFEKKITFKLLRLDSKVSDYKKRKYTILAYSLHNKKVELVKKEESYRCVHRKRSARI